MAIRLAGLWRTESSQVGAGGGAQKGRYVYPAINNPLKNLWKPPPSGLSRISSVGLSALRGNDWLLFRLRINHDFVTWFLPTHSFIKEYMKSNRASGDGIWNTSRPIPAFLPLLLLIVWSFIFFSRTINSSNAVPHCSCFKHGIPPLMCLV